MILHHGPSGLSGLNVMASRRLLPLLLILLVATPAVAMPAQASDWGPWGEEAATGPARAETIPSASLPFMSLIRGYQLVLSQQDAASCPMLPSCSRFSMEAFARFGPVQGLFMTTDRFLRENHDTHHHYPVIQVDDRALFLDPPTERNLW